MTTVVRVPATRLGLWLVAAPLLVSALLPSEARAQTPVASYLFNNTLSAQEAGRPALTAVDPLSLNGFETATVFGQNRTVYRTNGNATPITQQAGLTLNTTGLLPSNLYSVEMVFSFSDNVDAWRRIIDVQNRVSDSGLYVNPANQLALFPVTGGAPFTNNVFHHIVLTNALVGSDQTVNAYIDGTFSFNVVSNLMNISNVNNPANLMHFFLDDAAVQGEFSDARTALIRVYDTALTSGQVATLAQNPFVVTPPAAAAPEPSSLALIGLAGLSGGGMIARRKRVTR